MIILEAPLIEFIVFLVECAFYLCRFSDQSRRASLLDRSPEERSARRRMRGLGCAVILAILVVAVAILRIAH